MMNTRWHWLLAGLMCLLSTPVLADSTCPGSALRAYPPTLNFRVDNDLFGGAQQDQGYTNGAVMTLISPNLVDYTHDPCLPALARWVNRRLERLHPGEFEQQNMIFRLGQALYTPADSTRSDLIVEDRPYASVLLAILGYNARSGDRLRTTQIGLGVAGPWAMGQQVQNAVHHITGSDKFMGWDNQLRNEPVFLLLHARIHHWPLRHSASGWGVDALTHWSAALGNLRTYANLGAELRLGYRLPDDFGSSPFNPAGENTAPTRRDRTQGHAQGTSGHLFVMLDARRVLRDLTLDGNSFGHSHQVSKRPWMGNIGYGVAIMHGRWKFAFARYHLTREFNGQAQTPISGSFTISRAL